MRIFILNWKDIKNPKSGGAEILTHEMARRFVQQGHQVILFVSYFKGAKKKEIINGVTVIRSGKPDPRALTKSVYYQAYKYYQSNIKGKIDVIIDEVHGIPFFAKFYAKEKVIALICEVADDIWFRMFSFPINSIGWILERFYLFLYKGLPILTISQSTKKELVHCGMVSHDITVLPMGITRVATNKLKKEKKPTVIFVGRLNKMKGIEDAIWAVANSKMKVKNINLWIVGRGEEVYMKYLKLLTKKAGIESSTIFWNHVTQQKKFELMARAHVIVVPSLREGFGLIVPEAGSVNTPAIAYNVHGLRDTIKHNINGILVNKTVKDLSKGIEKIFTNKNKYTAFTNAAEKESRMYNWDNTAKIALKVMVK